MLHRLSFLLCTLMLTNGVQSQTSTGGASLKTALTFCTTFEHGLKADFAKGDDQLYLAPNYDQVTDVSPDQLPKEVFIEDQGGKFGQALSFTAKGKPVIFYQAANNIHYSESNWSGTISLWLSLDPEQDLAPGYTDPIQITDAGYDDAALWVDFSDKNPRDFRMGVFGDVTIWNPDKKSPDQNPDFQNRLVKAKGHPFGKGQWTHVVMTFKGLNTDRGRATFYINGKKQGKRKIHEPFTWQKENAKIFLGLNYIGLLDEVSIFDRALNSKAIRTLYRLPGGVSDLVN